MASIFNNNKIKKILINTHFIDGYDPQKNSNIIAQLLIQSFVIIIFIPINTFL